MMEPSDDTNNIINPPPHIQSKFKCEFIEIADKTARFVAKHGGSFEEMLLNAEANNPKFSFLKPNDVYYPYYMKMIAEYTAEINGEDADINTSQVLFEQDAQIQPSQPKRPIREPPPDQFYLTRPFMTTTERYFLIH